MATPKPGRVLVTTKFGDDKRVTYIDVGRAGTPWSLSLRPDEIGSLINQIAGVLVLDLTVKLGRRVTARELDQYIAELGAGAGEL